MADDAMPHDTPDAEYGLVMPFVVCQSNDGPYDDEAFVAGCYSQSVWNDLEVVKSSVWELRYTVPTPLVPQIDLIAMHFGFTMAAEVWDEHPDEWTFVTLRRTEATDG